MDEPDSGRGILLASSSGREQFALSPAAEPHALEVCIYSVTISGTFWERNVPLSNASLVNDYLVHLPQVAIDEHALRVLFGLLDDWMASRKHFDLQLSPLNYRDQKLEVSIGKVSELLYSDEKPAFTVRYIRGAAMSGCWTFVVDRSCIESFRNRLALSNDLA